MAAGDVARRRRLDRYQPVPLTFPEQEAVFGLVKRTGQVGRDALWALVNEARPGGWGAERRIGRDRIGAWLKELPFVVAGQRERVRMPRAYYTPERMDYRRRANIRNISKTVIGTVQSDGPARILQADLADVVQWSALTGWLYLLVVVDIFSKYVHVFPLMAKTAEAVTQPMRMLLTNLRNWGTPVEILSTDNGVEFTGPFSALLHEFGVKHVRGAPGIPQSQGAAEAAVKKVKRAIAMWIAANATTDYRQGFTDIVATLNNKPHTTTGVAPRILYAAPQLGLDWDTYHLAMRNQRRTTDRIRAMGRVDWWREFAPGNFVTRLTSQAKNPMLNQWESVYTRVPVEVLETKRMSLGVRARLDEPSGRWWHPRSLRLIEERMPLLPGLRDLAVPARTSRRDLLEAAARRRDSLLYGASSDAKRRRL